MLLYREFPLPVLTAFGPADACAPLWAEALAAAPAGSRLFAVCLPEHRAFVDRLSPFTHASAMFRMRLPADVPLHGPGGVARRRLGPADLAAAHALFARGALPEEEPEFFTEAMLQQGLYHGIWDGDRLIAMAGTHVLAPGASAAAIGNVFTDRACRGRGLAHVTTAAVARDLRAAGIATIVLNVRQDNLPAVRVYEGLGFVVHGDFFEGWALPKIAT